MLLLPLLLRAQESNLSAGLVFDGEPYLVINPSNTRNVAVAWMGYVLGQGITIKIKSSSDGGSTWSGVKTLPHLSPTWHSADPSMAFAKNGKLYLSYVDYRQSPDSGGVFVCSSTDGGNTWSTPVQAFDLFDNGDKPLDRPWLAVDRSASATSGNLYITTKPAPWDPTPNHPYYKYSTDGGNTWSSICTLDSADYPSNLIPAPMAYPTVSSTGKLTMIYPSWKGGLNPARFVVGESTDGGQTITRREVLSITQGNGGDTIAKLGYTILVNPADPNNLVFTGPDKSSGDYDITSMYTLNGGNSWSARQRVNDDSTGNNRDQEMVWQHFDESGNLAVAWRDRRHAGGSGYAQDYDIYAAVSRNKGQTFSKNFRLNQATAPYNTLLEQNGNDFLGLALADDTVYCAWGDMRTGKLNIFFSKTSASTGSNTSVRVAEEPLSLQCYPNPANHSLYLPVSVTRMAERYTLLDASGRIIRTATIPHNQPIDVSELPRGLYWLQVQGKSLDALGRFVKD